MGGRGEVLVNGPLVDDLLEVEVVDDDEEVLLPALLSQQEEGGIVDNRVGLRVDREHLDDSALMGRGGGGKERSEGRLSARKARGFPVGS